MKIVDARKLTDRESSHEYLKEQLGLPEYYGKNLDALYDCLTEMSEPVLFEGEDEAGDYYGAVKAVYDDACAQNPDLLNNGKEGNKNMSEEKKVLATVDGEEVTVEDLETFLDTAPEEHQKYRNNPRLRRSYLDQLLGRMLLAKLGEEWELDKTEDFEKIMKSARSDILARLAMAKAIEGVMPSDEEVEKYYNEHQSQFMSPESAIVSHILTDTEEKCRLIKEEIECGAKTFEEAAKTYSMCQSGEQGGCLNTVQRGQMVPEFEDAVFTCEKNKICGPVKTEYGYHLILVTARVPQSVIPFKMMKNSLKDQLSEEARDNAYQVQLKRMEKKYLQLFDEEEE